MASSVSDQKIIKNTSYGHEQLASITFDDADASQDVTITWLTGAPKGVQPTFVSYSQTTAATGGGLCTPIALATNDLTVPDFDVRVISEVGTTVAGAVFVVRAMWVDAADQDGDSTDHF